MVIYMVIYMWLYGYTNPRSPLPPLSKKAVGGVTFDGPCVWQLAAQWCA